VAGSSLYVHYAKSPIVGDCVIPWDELDDDLRAVAGHEARVHERRFPEQWRSDRVYIHEFPSCASVLNIGTGYSSESSWVYEVDPVPPIELDPERNGHLSTSRICLRALVIGCLHRPITS
jgi:hypothetical protein